MNPEPSYRQSIPRRIPRIYPKLFGGPLYWMDEKTGVLKHALMAYLKHQEVTPLLLDYLNYWIEAPCWRTGGDAQLGPRDSEYIARVDKLIATSQTMRTAAEVQQWIDDCLDEGIDPL